MDGAGRETFGALVRRYRQAAALSQEGLAARAGLSVDAVSVIERGKRAAPRPDTVALLVQALDLAGAARAAFIAAAHPPRAAMGRLAARHPGSGGAASVAAGALQLPPLPVPPTTFIGRTDEIAAVRARLLDPHTRLLTLTGPGGAGKTRLALAVARAVGDAFPAGACFVDLAPLTDPALVLPTIARALGLAEAGSQPVRALLHAYLRTRQQLLVLDNFEQVLEAALVVSDVLATCAGVRVLVTSRAALHLRGERLYSVPPLTLPDLTSLPLLETLRQSEALRLFVDRAQDVKPDFALTAENAPSVAAICARLDGLPLAIELAAARARLFAPVALLAHLGNRLEALTQGARDLPERQRTLRATIDWSYRLLSAEEQRLFARLAVFVGGRTLAALDAICTGDGALDVVSGVESLVEKSLLVPTEVGGEARFMLLETIHEYARERLEASGEADAVRRRHASFYLALAEAGEQGLKGRAQVAWLRRLAAEHDNLRAALVWAQAHDCTVGLRMAGALWQFWWMRGYLSEGRRRVEGLLAQAGAQTVAPVVRAKALAGGSALVLSHGDVDQAQAWAAASLQLAQAAGSQEVCAYAWASLGVVAMSRADYGQAIPLWQQSRAAFDELGDQWGSLNMLSNLAEVAHAQGDDVRAAALSQEALLLNRETGDEWVRSFSLSTLGEVARAQGDAPQAAALYEESLVLSRDLGDKRNIAATLMRQGTLALTQNDYARATALYQESLALGRSAGNTEGVSDGLEGLAEAAWGLGCPERAARLYGAAVAGRAALGTPRAPTQDAAYDRRVAAVRVALGEQVFARAWAEGEALTLDQALEEVLA